ncbi:MAG: imidazole glycerol phosphate synthase subunit HisH [Verrucomicrobiota bacterium]
MIGIVDYGIGNLRSVEKAFQKVNGEPFFAKSSSEFNKAKALVLPGVGNFGDCVRALHSSGMWEGVLEWIRQDRPLLGICVGYQMLFESSEEDPSVQGLGVLKGKVIKFRDTSLKIPQIGWNQVKALKPSPLTKGLREGEYFYFVHSFHPILEQEADGLFSTEYGTSFISGIARSHLYGAQFHPEKSQDAGLTLLKNYVEAYR